MISTPRFLLAAGFACLLPFGVFSEAPVVDDSENFALLDEQQAAFEQPVARSEGNITDRDEETALASEPSDADTNNRNNDASLLGKIQGLQQDVQELRGQVEVQAHDLKLLQQQQLAFYKDLDARLQGGALKTAKKEPTPDLSLKANAPSVAQASPPQGAPVVVAPVINQTARSNPANEQISYLAAYELVKNKHYDEAITAMQTFVTQYPHGGYTANAEYWLGELYMVKTQYPEAMQHFAVVLQQFPSSSKAAASLLKMGYALAATGKKQDAIEKLRLVVKTYPDTHTARLAKDKLETLTS